MTRLFNGPVPPIAENSGFYVFSGPSAQVTTSASHRRLTGSASAPLGLATGSPPQYADVGLCYQPAAGGAITNFVGNNFSVHHFTTTRVSYAASATVVLGADQTWNVGMCVRNNGGSKISNNNYVTGWIQVTS